MTDSKPTISAAEASSVTPASVVSGLGFPNDRLETSPNPTGWMGAVSADALGTATGELAKVSRETSE